MKSSAARLQAGFPSGERRAVLSWLDNLWVAAALVFVLAVLIRAVDLGSLPRWDELYTILAARGWLSEGVPRIGDGVYDRVQLYTILVAWCLELFGDNMVVARLPSVLFGSLLAVAVFVWTDAHVGRAVAWVSALFVVFAPLSIEMSIYARFYALHALVFWLAAVGTYALASGQVAGTSRRIALAAGTALALLGAYYLQLLTLLGAVGLAVWLSIALLVSEPARRHYRSRGFWILLAALALAAAGAVFAFLSTEVGAYMVRRYVDAPLTVIQHQNQIWFYHLLLIERYPLLWPVLPFLALLAVAAHPRPSLWALCIFGTVFTLLSFGGQKSWRYLFFALPFLFVLWAIALTRLWPALRTVLAAALTSLLQPVRPALRPLLGGALIAGGCAFLLLANGSTARTVLGPFGLQLEKGYSAGWPGALATLEPYVRDADVVLSSNELHMLYYLGRVDISVSKERLRRLPETDFVLDSRTGLPVVTRPGSLDLIIDCYRSGVLVTDTIKGWRDPTVIDREMSDLIERRMTPIELPPGLNLKAFEWHTPTPADPSRCATIPGYA